MSKRKPTRSKETKSTVQPVSKEAASPKDGSSFVQAFVRMLFAVAAVLACGVAIYNALDAKDVVNPYIEENLPKLLSTQALIFGAIAACFVYFAFKLVFSIAKRKIDYAVLFLAFVAINGNFVISFDKDIGSFGDNASYIINAKALLTKGGPYKLDHVDEPYDYKAALGLPVMLTPIVAFWGMDVLKMKGLVFALGSLSILFFFMAFEKRLGIYTAAILTILIGTYPLVVYNTSYVMTEVPFLFALAVTMYSAYCFMDATSWKRVVVLGVVTSLLAILTYLTRAVGIGVIAGLVAWLFVSVPWKKIVKKELSITSSMELRKFALVGALLFVFVIGWQMRSTGSEVVVDEQGTEQVVKNKSQAGSFVQRNIAENFKRNYDLCQPLWAQQVFSKKLSRWYLSLGKAARLNPNEPGLASFNAFMFLTLIIGLFRRKLAAYCFFFIVAATLTGSNSDTSIVFSRYLIVVLPLLFYIFLDFFIDGSKFLSDRLQKPFVHTAGLLGAVIFSFFILSHNFSGMAFNNQRQNAGDTYTIAFDNYILAAKWAKTNLPKGTIVASRKPRLFYIFSEKQSIVTVYSGTQVYTKEVEDEIIERMRDRGAKYLILDGFSTASRKVVLPMVQNNTDLFRIVEAIGERYPAYVVEFSG